MRCMCPRNEVDWEQSGGLCCCNWPMYDPPSDAPDTMRIVFSDESSLTIEVERTQAMIPCMLIAALCVLPWMPPLLAASHIEIEAWHFYKDKANGGKIALEKRQKTPCAEHTTVVCSDVALAHIQTVEDHESQSTAHIIKRRIAICTKTEVAICSPWVVEQSNSLELTVEKINNLIAPEVRAVAFIPPPVPYQRQEMDRRPRVVEEGNSLFGPRPIPIQCAVEILDDESFPVDVSMIPLDDGAQATTNNNNNDNNSNNNGESNPVVTVDQWSNIPLSEIVDRLRRELGISDEGLTLSEVIHLACRELAVEESGVLKSDAVNAVRHLCIVHADLLA
eukprot:gene4575-5015_t